MSAKDGAKHESAADAAVPKRAFWKRWLPLGLFGRALAVVKKRPILSGLLSVGGAAIVVGGVVVGLLFLGRDEKKVEEIVTLQQTLEQLDEGNLEEARTLASRLFTQRGSSSADTGGAMYVLGLALVHDAEQKETDKEKKPLLLVASRYLEEAARHGFPKDRAASANEVLARCFYDMGRYAQALAPLRKALEANPANRTELQKMLAEAYFRDANPQWDKALVATRELLAQTDLEPEDRSSATWREIELLFHLHELDACREALAALPENSADRGEIQVIQGQLLLHDADDIVAVQPKNVSAAAAAAEKVVAALELFRRATKSDSRTTDASREADYLIGICLLRQGKLDEAENRFARTHSIYQETAEALAAGLEEADILLHQGRDEDALRAYRRVLSEAGPADEYSNRWLPLNEFRRRVEKAYRHFITQDQFALALDLTETMQPSFAESRAVQLTAEAQRRWAELLAREVVQLPPTKSAALSKEVREKYRRAAKSFSKLSTLRAATKDFPNDVWQTAECFMLGRDFERAEKHVQKYLTTETKENRARALVALGDIRLSLNRPSAAVKPLQDCLEFYPRDPDSYRARFLLSQIYQERGELVAAKEMLIINLENGTLTPQSPEWRNSLFELGKLFHRDARQLAAKAGTDTTIGNAITPETLKTLEDSHYIYLDAVRRLEELIQRQPDGPHNIEARYMIADARRQLVRWPKAKLTTTILETTRGSLERQMEQALTAAAEDFRLLRERLSERSEQTELNAIEAGILRNSSFSRPDALYELGQYETAIEEYSLAVTRYQNEPEALEALVRIATCQKHLAMPREAFGTLRQAQLLLQRLPTDADFVKTTRYNRAEWNQLLNWMIAL